MSTSTTTKRPISVSLVDSGIIGVWSLVSCKLSSSSGQVLHPYGERPRGILQYSPEGWVTLMIDDSSRKEFSVPDLARVPISEKAHAFDGFDAYAGRYSVDASRGVVVHHINCARVTSWIGKDHERFYTLREPSLFLMTDWFEMSGERWRAHLEWLRA